MQFALWGIIFTNAMVYLFLSFSSNVRQREKNRDCVSFYIISTLIAFYRKHGFPTFSKTGVIEYLKLAIVENTLQRVFGALLLLMGPNTMALFALLFPEFANFAAGLVAKFREYQMNRLADMILKLFAGTLLEKSGEPFHKVPLYSAYAEVAAGMVLIMLLLTPQRNILFLVLYWQYLQMRYLIEVAAGKTRASYASAAGGVLHQAFLELDRRILSVTSKLPFPVGYNLLKGFLARQVTLPDPNQPSSSFASKCTLM